jgi:TPR repeat protein
VAADPAQAVALYEKAAKGGVVGAFSKLAQAYARGAGVAKDRDKALAFARRAAQLGDVEGTFFLSVILTAEYLGYLDAGGKADDKKYWQLARRPLSERAIDTEARDALYWSAEKGYQLAMMTLALNMGGSVGDGNRKRMQTLIDKLPNNTYPALQNYGRISRHMDTLGDSYASPQLFFDAQTQQMVAAMLQTCGLRDQKEMEKLPMPKLIATKITKPVSNAVYLPSKVAGYDRAYLIAGEWEEGWTYTGCEKTATVMIKFTADGLGGARILSEQTMKGS